MSSPHTRLCGATAENHQGEPVLSAGPPVCAGLTF